MRRTLLLALVLFASVASAQDTRETELRTRLAAHADDLGARCELAFVLVQSERFADARALLDPTLDQLPAPRGSADRSRRGACLYNLGRAEEGLAHRDAAITRYRASLALRPNASVDARLGALLPATTTATAAPPPTTTAPATTYAHLSLCALPASTNVSIDLPLADGHHVLVLETTGVSPEILTQWSLALGDDHACERLDPFYTQAHAWPDREGATITVRGSVEASPTDPRVVVRLHISDAGWTGTTTARQRAFETDLAIIAWLNGGHLSSFTLPIASTERVGSTTTSAYALTLSFDDHGRTVLALASGTAPAPIARMIGTHTLPMRDVPELIGGEPVPNEVSRALRGRLFPTTRVIENTSEDGITAMLLFSYVASDDDIRGIFVPVITSGGAWLVAPPIAQFYPPDNDMLFGSDYVEATMSVRPILAGGAPALVIEHMRGRRGSEPGEELMGVGVEVSATSVVWIDADRAHTWTLPTRIIANTGVYITPMTASIAFADGNVTYTQTGGRAIAAVRAALGTHGVADVTTRWLYRTADEPVISISH